MPERPESADGPGSAVPPPAGANDVVGESYPRELRILRGADYRRILAKAWKWTTAHLVIHAMPNGLAVSRIGLTVSRKVGNAVVRNRVRRRLKESFRRRIRQALGSPCIDLVLRALPGAGGVTQAVLEAEVMTGLESLRRGDSQGRPRRRGKEG